MKKILTAAVLAAAFLLGCACGSSPAGSSQAPEATPSAQPSEKPSSKPAKPTGLPLPEEPPVSAVDGWAEVGALGRTYMVYEYSGQQVARWFYYYIPSTYQPGEKLPLMFTLHGSTANATYQINDGNWQQYAEQKGFILVAPEAVAIHADGTLSSEGKSMAEIQRSEMQWLRWNAVDSDPQGGFGVDDVQYISDLIDLFTGTGYADPARVYSCGLSHGGFMSLKLAVELPEKIAGVGIVSALLCPQYTELTMAGQPKLVFLHGTADEVVPIEGMVYDFDGDGEKEYLWAHSLEDSVNWFLQQYGMSGQFSETPLPDTSPYDGTTITRRGYTNEAGEEWVVTYIIDGGGHTWPGGAGYSFGVTTRDAKGTLLIWNELKDVVNPAFSTP